MVNDVDLLRQRELNFAIVDEVDSILIDEARTPLIISAPAAENPDNYYTFAKIAAKLVPEDYVLDEKRRSVALTDEGVEKVQKLLGIKKLVHTRSRAQCLSHGSSFASTDIVQARQGLRCNQRR